MPRILALLATVAATLLALAGPANARPASQPRIVGGIQSPSAWPAQGYLQITGLGSCAGTLLSGRWFLTAAHCVTDDGVGNPELPPSAFTVKLGSSNRNLATAFGVVDVIRHEGYNPSTDQNDIALLKLVSLPASPAVVIAPLTLVAADESALWAPGTVAKIIGWGTTCFGPGCQTVTNLREAEVPITSDAFCDSAYGGIDETTMVCAGNGIADACQGDSGGPLMVARVDAWVLAGVTSTGIGCADPNFPGIYARVGGASLNGWIRDRVPMLRISPSAFDPAPDPGDDVALQATSAPGLHGPPVPNLNWDLDDDGAFDDATGATAQLNSISAGSHVVKVRLIYPDNDCAVAREVITTVGSTPPQPPDPAPLGTSTCPSPPAAPVPPPPPPPGPPAPPPPPPPVTPPLAKLVSIPKKIRVSSLMDRRLTVHVQCSAACFVESTMTLDAKSSRKLRFTRRRSRSVRIGTADAERLDAGLLRVTLRLSRRTAKRLRPARSGTLTLRFTATGDDENVERLTARIKLRR